MVAHPGARTKRSDLLIRKKDSASAPAQTKNRAIRGVRLYEEHGNEIEALGGGRYSVPSCSGEDRYTVATDGEGEFVSCECEDHQYRGRVCKHFYALATLKAKARANRPARFVKGDVGDVADYFERVVVAL